VKPKLLFLLKFLAYSLALFIFRHQLVDGYSSVLGFIIHSLNPQYPVSPDIAKITYIDSLTMIAFIAVIPLTPRIPMKKKAVYFFSGISLFLLIDYFGIQYLIFPHGQFKFDDNSSPVRQLYLFSKWFVPFAIWIMMSYPHMGELFKSGIENVSPQYACPICEESQADVMRHIIEVHGIKSLQIKKVKRFISENSKLSVDVNQ
jgi:hypothetical protein